jgi:hypothetical protein
MSVIVDLPLPPSGTVDTEDWDGPEPWMQGRIWMLLLLEAAQRAGLTPMPGWQVHRLAFLADCLSPVYGLPTRSGKILKWRRGPFVRDRQWDLDRLAIQGLGRISNIQHRQFKRGWWFFADYSLRPKGMAAAKTLAMISPSAAELRTYLQEIASAYEELHATARKRAALEDASYSDPEILEDDVVNFSELRYNFSVRVTQAFQTHVPNGVPLNERDRVYLYFRYLNRVVEKAAG